MNNQLYLTSTLKNKSSSVPNNESHHSDDQKRVLSTPILHPDFLEVMMLESDMNSKQAALAAGKSKKAFKDFDNLVFNYRVGTIPTRYGQ